MRLSAESWWIKYSTAQSTLYRLAFKDKHYYAFARRKFTTILPWKLSVFDRSGEDSAVELSIMIMAAEKARSAFFLVSTLPETFTCNLTVAFDVKTHQMEVTAGAPCTFFCALDITIKTHASSSQHEQICPNQSDEVKDFQLKRE